MRSAKALAGLAGVVAAIFLSDATPAAAQPIGGNYNVSGTNFDGSSYSGTATITLTSEVTCQIEWETGGSTSQGICMRSGPVFSAAYQLGDQIGMIIYEVLGNGTLDGRWTISGSDGVGTETLSPR
jgi:hypothetical protein